MAANFPHTLRSLEQRQGAGWWLLPAFALLGAWGAWMLYATIWVYASAANARIEVDRAPSRIASELGGRVVRVDLALGATVQRGQLLLELDDSVMAAMLQRERARLEALRGRRQGLEAQLRAERAKRGARLELGAIVSERAALGFEQARAAALREQELARIAEELRREQLNSRVDAVHAESKLRESRIAVAESQKDLERLSAEQRYEDRSDQARLLELERQLLDLDAERATTEVALSQARAELARLRIVAPESGVVGSVAPLQVGDIVEGGRVIATIVPRSEVRVVAYFPPGPAVGRILPGQLAQLRLHGFSWMEFGMLYATVTHAASEPRDELIRVELQLAEADRLRIPVQHGLTGAIDVRIEGVSPWTLLERSVGSRLMGESRASLARLSPERHEP
ncbi:MAG: hypothetical protein RL685_4100 [Pseudomonadota bacterium]|jgi:membrane fusion protein (multidrug efflux system)